jgi:hypothetical protein
VTVAAGTAAGVETACVDGGRFRKKAIIARSERMC